jgi:hypothetical protein
VVQPVQRDLRARESFEILDELRVAVESHAAGGEQVGQVNAFAQVRHAREQSPRGGRRDCAPVSRREERDAQTRVSLQQPSQMTETAAIKIAAAFVSVRRLARMHVVDAEADGRALALGQPAGRGAGTRVIRPEVVRAILNHRKLFAILDHSWRQCSSLYAAPPYAPASSPVSASSLT